MSSRLWASSEDMSTDSSVDRSKKFVSRDASADEDIPRLLDRFPEGESRVLARPLPSGEGAVARAMATNTRIPNLQPSEHASLFYLSLIEGRCKTKAAETLNRTRPPQHFLSEDDPEVCHLAKSLFKDMRKELQKAGLIQEDSAYQDHPELRENYLNAFDTILTSLASSKAREVASSNGFKAIGNAQSLSISEDFSSSDESKALILFGESAMASRPRLPQLLSILCQKENAGDLKRSVYSTEYKQLSCLGKGGFGKVYKAQHFLDNGIYAIKEIMVPVQRLRHLAATNRLDSVLTEVSSMAELNHHHVVRYHHCWLEASIARPKNKGKKSKTRSIESGIMSLSLDSIPKQQAELSDCGIEFGISNSNRQAGLVLSRNMESLRNINPPDTLDIVQFGYSGANSQAERSSQISSEESHNSADLDEEEIPLPSSINMDAHIYVKMAVYPLSLEDLIWSDQQKCTPDNRINYCHHPRPALRLLHGIVDGLEYLHRRKIIHRDMKPANIFLSILEQPDKPTQGYVDIYDCVKCGEQDKGKEREKKWLCPCLGDFGLATLLREPQEEPESSDSDTDSEAETKLPTGTLLYLPLEVKQVCEKLDVYALGVITFEMMYRFGTKQERFNVINRIRETKAFPDDWEERAEERVREGIEGMLRQDRQERWDLGQVRGWLDGLL